MSTITKKELTDRIAKATQNSHSKTNAIIQHFLEEMSTELAKGNRLEFRDFGVFEVKRRVARTAQNPKTLERVRVPAKRAVKFRMGRPMKQKLDSQPSKQ
jgi:integration host factor subunit beta